MDMDLTTLSEQDISTQFVIPALQQAGWSETDIVILSQLASFLSFQIRLVAGLRVLGARAAVTTASSTLALQAQP